MGKTAQATKKVRAKKNLGRKKTLKKSQRSNNPRNKTVQATKSIADPVIKAAWDKHKTVKQNFQALGLVRDPNARDPKVKSAVAKADANTGSLVIEKLQRIVDDHVPTTRFAAAGEISFVHQLIQKHGDDYIAMSRDHKLNPYQHTPKQLERKVAKVRESLNIASQHGLDNAN